MAKSYADKLRDPRWQKKRLEILQLSEFCCISCGDSESELHVHHLVYEKGKEPWESQYLIPVCKACHKDLESVREDILAIMASCPPSHLFELHGALCSILGSPDPYANWREWMDRAEDIRRAAYKKQEIYVQ